MIIAPLYCNIALSRGQVARVSPHRYDEINQWKWYALWNSKARSFYAARTICKENGERQTIYMHRVILGLAIGDRRDGDHIETGQTLDNTDGNLRIATHVENLHNTRICRANTSGFKGVTFHSEKKKWMAQIKENGKTRFLGYFLTPEIAHDAYCVAAQLLYGEFGRVG